MWRQEVKCHVSPAASGCLGPLSPYTAGWLHPHGWNEEDVNSPHSETSPQLCIQITPENTSQSRTNKDSFLNNAHRRIQRPFDALKGAAGHVNDAPCWSGQSSDQTFAHTLKETRRSFLLSSCSNTHTHTRCPLNWAHWFMTIKYCRITEHLYL